jgi:hypothetical protein
VTALAIGRLPSQTVTADNERINRVTKRRIGEESAEALVAPTTLVLGRASRTATADVAETLKGRDVATMSWFMTSSPG